MKKTNNKMQLLLLSVVLLGTTACTGDFADINRNPNEVTDEQLQANNYKIGTNLKTLQGLVVPTEEHRFQFVESIVGCPYAGYNGKTVDTWQATFENYNPSADWRKVPFVDMISDTYPAYRAIINGTEDVVAQALAKLFRIAIMQRVTDTRLAISVPTKRAASTFPPFSNFMSTLEALTNVFWLTSSMICTWMCALLLNTHKRGHSGVPLIFVRTRL